MPIDDWTQRWQRIRDALGRALATLPPDSLGDTDVMAAREFLWHSEFELACDMLEEYGERCATSRDFWLALRDAATEMELAPNASRYARRAESDRPA